MFNLSPPPSDWGIIYFGRNSLMPCFLPLSFFQDLFYDWRRDVDPSLLLISKPIIGIPHQSVRPEPFTHCQIKPSARILWYINTYALFSRWLFNNKLKFIILTPSMLLFCSSKWSTFSLNVFYNFGSCKCPRLQRLSHSQ